MSFSAQVKQELCRAPLSRTCCARAEALGVLLFCHTFATGEIRIITQSPALKVRLPALFTKAFRVEFDACPPAAGEGKATFLLQKGDKLSAVFRALDCDPARLVAHHVNFALLEEAHCRLAFLRGAFLAGGSVTDPAKRYHLELATSHSSVAREAQALMGEAGFEAKLTARGSNSVLYFKKSEHIEDFLTATGAPVAAMEVMNAKLEKDLVGRVNRRVNCDAANVDKSVAAAQAQIRAIERLEREGRLSALPDKLGEAARLRMENPELTLSQLAALCDPPVTKSCFNHRLRKLAELAGEEPAAPV